MCDIWILDRTSGLRDLGTTHLSPLKTIPSCTDSSLRTLKNVEFRSQHNKFQDQLQQDIRKINSSTKAFIPADKTTNFCEVHKPMHDKLLMDNLTSTYKKANTIHSINNEAKNIASNLFIDDRVKSMAEQQAFITLKDHKDNFVNKPINPAKSEIRCISKQILENVNTTVRQKTGLNQWKNSASVINWYSDIPSKNRHTFAVFDIESFYPSITEKLLTDYINFALKSSGYTTSLSYNKHRQSDRPSRNRKRNII